MMNKGVFWLVWLDLPHSTLQRDYTKNKKRTSLFSSTSTVQKEQSAFAAATENTKRKLQILLPNPSSSFSSSFRKKKNLER